jgi:PIN domain nuclease of toxin-antitoxin system
MRLLVDSHVALWWLTDDSRLGPDARVMIGDADVVAFSAVTPWELGIKRELGKLHYPSGLVDQLIASGFEPLPITARHAELATALPPHHHDPFDRMLVAQAMTESLQLVTADRSLDPYGVPLVNACR